MEATFSTILIYFLVLVSRPAPWISRWIDLRILKVLFFILLIFLIPFAFRPLVVLVGILEAIPIVLHIVEFSLLIWNIIEILPTIIFLEIFMRWGHLLFSITFYHVTWVWSRYRLIPTVMKLFMRILHTTTFSKGTLFLLEFITTTILVALIRICIHLFTLHVWLFILTLLLSTSAWHAFGSNP